MFCGSHSNVFHANLNVDKTSQAMGMEIRIIGERYGPFIHFLCGMRSTF